MGTNGSKLKLPRILKVALRRFSLYTASPDAEFECGMVSFVSFARSSSQHVEHVTDENGKSVPLRESIVILMRLAKSMRPSHFKHTGESRVQRPNTC